MRSKLMMTSAALLLAGTVVAAAQGVWDDPPGYTIQKRGMIEESGQESYRYGAFSGDRSRYRDGYWSYDAYGYAPYGYDGNGYYDRSYRPPRPGVGFQFRVR
jgi:hypothetical protein